MDALGAAKRAAPEVVYLTVKRDGKASAVNLSRGITLLVPHGVPNRRRYNPRPCTRVAEYRVLPLVSVMLSLTATKHNA